MSFSSEAQSSNLAINEIAQQSLENLKNAELSEYPINEEDLNKWSLPKVEKTSIYKIGTFDFKGKAAIKTIEQSIAIDGTDKTIPLICLNDLKPYMKDFKFAHIGLIQIAFKPLTLRGLNSSILACLRDGRCLNK